MTRLQEWLAENATPVEALLTAARAKLVTVALDASFMEVAHLFRVGIDLVVACNSEGAFAGVITKTDIVNQISPEHLSGCVALASVVIARDVVLCRPRDNLAGVWLLMQKRGFKNVPIIDDENHPIGVLTSSDALQTLLDEAEDEESSMRDYVMGVGYR